MTWAQATSHNANPRKLMNNDADYAEYIVNSGDTIYKNTLVVFEYVTSALTGYVTYAQNTANETFAGVAAEQVTGDGTKVIKVWRKGFFEFVKSTPAITDVGTEFYCDGGSSGTDATVQSGTTTGCKVGMCVAYKTSNVVLSIDGYCP